MAGRLLGRAAWWADDLHYSSRRAPRIAPSAACCVRAGERILHLGSLRRHQSTPACTLDSWPCARIARLPCRRDQNHLQPARIHPRCCLGRELSIHPGFDRRSSRRHSRCFKPPEASQTLCVRSVGANRNHSANCINASSSGDITLRRPNRKYRVSQRKFAHVATKCLGFESLISMFESKMRNCICVYSNRLQVFWDFSWISGNAS